MLKIIETTPTFFPSQLGFLKSTKKEVLYSGAFRAGKSRALCYAMWKQVQKNPLNSVLLVRKTCVSLRKSTLVCMLEDGDAPAVLPKGSYKHFKQEQYIQMKGGGKIHYTGLDDPMKIRSTGFGAIGIDEATELNLEEYLELMGRLSLKAGTRQIYSATNPAVPGHFLYKRFFLEKHWNREVFLARTIDNPTLPPDYLESLKDYPDVLYRRYALGEWVMMEGAIFENFDRKVHVKKLSMDEKGYNEYFIGVDIGYTDPSSVLLVGKNGSRVTVIDEFYKTKCLQDTIISKIADFYKWCDNPVTIVVDPSQAGLIATLQSLGFNCTKADNDIESGIHLIRQALELRNDSTDLMIGDTCVDLIKELELYCYKKDTEIPVDKDNHSIDGLRYVFNYIHASDIKPSPFLLSASDDDDAGWQPLSRATI